MGYPLNRGGVKLILFLWGLLLVVVLAGGITAMYTMGAVDTVVITENGGTLCE